jgi:predicted TIM-barrel fold metal-dependent hydrolase
MPAVPLLDCDTHATDHDPELWTDRMPPATRPATVEHDGRYRLRIGGLLFPKPTGAGQGNPKGLGHLIGPGYDEDRGRFMAEQGIAACVLQPGFVGLSAPAVPDAAVRTALLAGYNDMVAGACAGSGFDLRWSVLVSAEDPLWSVQEITRHGGDPNLVAATVRPTARTAASRLSSAAFRPVLDELAARRLALFLHGGTGCHQWSPLADAYEDYLVTHALGHFGEQLVALVDLVTRPDGLPEETRVVMLESGVGWIPSLLGRLDSHVTRLASGRARPSETFANHVAVVPDPEERHAAWALGQLGWDNVLFGSDYPHWDAVDSGDWFRVFGTECPRERLYGNTARFVPRLVAPSVVPA